MTALICFVLLMTMPDPTILWADKGTLEIEITAVRSAKGQVVVGIFSSSDGFPIGFDKTYKQFKQPAKSGTITLTCKDIPHGTYAITIWHDENGDDKINTNAVGFPKEGRGVSNNVKGKFGPPRYADAKFELNSPEKKLSIKMNY